MLRSCEIREIKYGGTWKEHLCRILQKPKPCNTCGKQTKWINYRDGFSTHCSSKCAGADPTVDKKRKNTNINKWGVERPQQHLVDIRNKFKRTMMSRYGAEYAAQIPEIREKQKLTCVEKYGVQYPFESKSVQKKIRKTNMERFGVEHVMQNRFLFENQQKSGFKTKNIKIHNKHFSLRGYEHYVVKWLARNSVPVKHIKTTSQDGVPSINWLDKNKNMHVYHPDMYIKVKNTTYIVEVKSTFTLGIQNTKSAKKSGKYSTVRRKAHYTEKSGYNFILFLVSDSGYIAPIKNISSKSRREVVQELKLLHPHKFRQL